MPGRPWPAVCTEKENRQVATAETSQNEKEYFLNLSKKCLKTYIMELNEEIMLEDEMADENFNRNSHVTFELTATATYTAEPDRVEPEINETDEIENQSDDEIVLDEDEELNESDNSIPDIEEYEIDNADELVTEDVDEIPDLEKTELQPPKQEFTCDFCDYSSNNQVNVRRHLENRAKNGFLKPFQCDICLYRNCNRKGIFRHKSIHLKAPTKYYNYELVPVSAKPVKAFVPAEPVVPEDQNSTNEESHSNTNINLRRAVFTCSFCPFKAKTRFSLTRHIQNHGDTEEGRRSPDQWGNKYERNAAMDWNDYTCEYCDFSTPIEKRLDNHMKRRFKNPRGPVSCHICGYRSCTTAGLTMHINRKHGAKPTKLVRPTMKPFLNEVSENDVFEPKVETFKLSDSKCDFCDFKPVSQQRLENHLKRRAEADYEPVKCEVCGYKSCTKQGLQLHFNRKHGTMQNVPKTEPPFVHSLKNSQKYGKEYLKNCKHFCQFCDFASQTRERLVNHLNLRLKNPRGIQTCDICDYKICTNQGYKVHMAKRHGYKSPRQRNRVTGAPKRAPLMLKISKDINRHKNHACSKCDYRTANRQDLIYHERASINVDVPLKCEFCPQTRCTRFGLNSHHRRDHGQNTSAKSWIKSFIKNGQYECDHCDFRTKYQPNLERHRKNMHEASIKFLERVRYVLPRPKKGEWIVPLKRMDPNDMDYMDSDE